AVINDDSQEHNDNTVETKLKEYYDEIIFDTESDGFRDVATKLHCIAAIADNQLFKFGPENINEGLQLLSRANRLIGHNIINHDLPIMSKLYNWSPEAHTEVFDTLIVSRLINPDRKAPEGY